MEQFDVIVVGAGPAGLSAALILGRALRRVLVLDAGHPRNERSRELHGFLTRDGTPPLELLKMGREQLTKYETVEVRGATVKHIERSADEFILTCTDDTKYAALKVLLATGVVDRLPDVEGIRDFYGTSVFHCPYCDGWELRGLPLAAWGRGASGVSLAVKLTNWSGDVVLCTDGSDDLNDEQRERLQRFNVDVREEPIARLEGEHGALQAVRFKNDQVLPRRALFFSAGNYLRTELAPTIGCRISEKGYVLTHDCESCDVPGLYVAGDAMGGTHMAIVAAADAASAAVAINMALTEDEYPFKQLHPAYAQR